MCAKHQSYSRGAALMPQITHPFSSIVSRLPSVSHTPRFHQQSSQWSNHKCPKVCFLVLDQITSISTTSNSFDSLFRVLFIFPSQYLFAIGFPSLFSLRWSIPPILSCTLKQLDSFTYKISVERLLYTYYGSVTLYAAAFHRTWCIFSPPKSCRL